jgi:ubiquinone/menaquinone biosynthesis C-methylase UbiE
MTREDHAALLSGGIAASGGSWADLGSGSGAFTAALAEALGPTAIIYSVDTDEHALRVQEKEMRARFPQLRLHLMRTDFNDILELPNLDGIVMANSLHFQSDACASLAHAVQWLKVGGRLIVVEYDVQKASPWVPHPIPWARLPDIAACAGLSDTRLIDVRPSRYHGRVYSAVGVKTA